MKQSASLMVAMIVQDTNNLEIADLILQWIDEHVGKGSGGRK